MNGEIGVSGEVDDVDDDVESDDLAEDTVVVDSDSFSDTVADLSSEFKVDELVAKIEAGDVEDLENKREIRRRLERLREQREAEKDIDSTFNFNIDEDV